MTYKKPNSKKLILDADAASPCADEFSFLSTTSQDERVGEAWSRRKFLGTGLLSVTGIYLVKTIALLPAAPVAAPSVFSSKQRATLLAAMDEIIPVGDGMPSASQAGCLDYLEHLAKDEKNVQRQLSDVLSQLDNLARSERKRDFMQLPSEQRVSILSELESRSTMAAFHNLRDLVYEAYYTQPAVWKLIGFEFYPPERPGPLPAPFDDAVLARVRRMPKLYREVD